MKISRYIYIPFKIGIAYALIYLVFGKLTGSFVGDFFIGTLLGFLLLAYNDYKVRKLLAKQSAEDLEESDIYAARPKRKLVLFTNYEKAFELCRESVEVLRRGKIKKSAFEEGIIVARSGISWNSFGNRITYKLKRLTNVTTEIELKSVPIPRTALVDYGEGWQALKNIANFLDEKNLEMNQKYLTENKSIPADIFVNAGNKKETKLHN